jgi:hypothetical protein
VEPGVDVSSRYAVSGVACGALGIWTANNMLEGCLLLAAPCQEQALLVGSWRGLLYGPCWVTGDCCSGIREAEWCGQAVPLAPGVLLCLGEGVQCVSSMVGRRCAAAGVCASGVHSLPCPCP